MNTPGGKNLDANAGDGERGDKPENAESVVDDDTNSAVSSCEPQSELPEVSPEDIEDFKPFSVRKFLLLTVGSLVAVVVLTFVMGFFIALSGSQPSTFDNEIIQGQLDEVINGGEETIPAELEKND